MRCEERVMRGPDMFKYGTLMMGLAQEIAVCPSVVSQRFVVCMQLEWRLLCLPPPASLPSLVLLPTRIPPPLHGRLQLV